VEKHITYKWELFAPRRAIDFKYIKIVKHETINKI